MIDTITKHLGSKADYYLNFKDPPSQKTGSTCRGRTLSIAYSARPIVPLKCS